MMVPGRVFETGLDSVQEGIMAVRFFAERASAFATTVAWVLGSLLGIATPVSTAPSTP